MCIGFSTQSIPKDTLYVFPKQKLVSEYNQKMFNKGEGDNEVVTAKNILPTRQEFKPVIDKDENVDKTPLENVLCLKKGVRIVLVHDINVEYGLNNGAKRQVIDFIRDEDGHVKAVVVEFDIPETGKELRDAQTNTFRNKYPTGTPISKLYFHCSFSKKQAVQGQKQYVFSFRYR